MGIYIVTMIRFLEDERYITYTNLCMRLTKLPMNDHPPDPVEMDLCFICCLDASILVRVVIGHVTITSSYLDVMPIGGRRWVSRLCVMYIGASRHA